MPELKRPAGDMSGNEVDQAHEDAPDAKRLLTETLAEAETNVDSGSEPASASSSRESTSASAAVEIPACLIKHQTSIDVVIDESQLVFDFEQFIETEPSPEEVVPEFDAPPFVGFGDESQLCQDDDDFFSAEEEDDSTSPKSSPAEPAEEQRSRSPSPVGAAQAPLGASHRSVKRLSRRGTKTLGRKLKKPRALAPHNFNPVPRPIEIIDMDKALFQIRTVASKPACLANLCIVHKFKNLDRARNLPPKDRDMVADVYQQLVLIFHHYQNKISNLVKFDA